MEVKKCLNCGGEKIVPYVHIRDYTKHGVDDLEIGIYADPSAVIIKETHTAGLRGALCCDCGFVHVFAIQGLGEIWNIYQKEKHNWNLQR